MWMGRGLYNTAYCCSKSQKSVARRLETQGAVIAA